MSKAAFRVDASLDIGTGHVLRCLVLADALKDTGVECIFICREHSGHLIDFIKSSGYKVITLEIPPNFANQTLMEPHLKHASWLGVNQFEDAIQCLDKLQQERLDWLIVDHYGIDFHWEKLLKPICKHIIIIDDLADRKHVGDCLIDQTLGREPCDYAHLIPSESKLLLGTRYALVRPEFSAMREKAYERLPPGPSVQVLVSMGGVDQNNVTLKVLRFLSEKSGVAVTVLLSPRAPHYLSVASYCKASQNIHHIDFSGDVAQLMLRCDIAIGAPGSTSWERACLGLPSIVIPLADNQHQISRVLQSRHAAVIVRLANLDADLSGAYDHLVANWTKYHNASLLVCDGLGVNHVMIELEHLDTSVARNFGLVKASREDIKKIFEWQSNPVTRKYSLNSQAPTWAQHIAWMEKKLSNTKDFFYMTVDLDTQKKVGVVRLDHLDDKCYLVSIFVNPDSYGKGIGIKSLSLLDDIHRDITIHATVLPEHIASQNLFQKANYERAGANKFIRKPIVRPHYE